MTFIACKNCTHMYAHTDTVQPLFMNMYDLFNTIPVNDLIIHFNCI